ncbi:MAG: peptidase S41 [Halobacteriovoraceae bacterium]|jgi:tricorn protease|nr:peptidase S41 [Halobacteriovoraceae bacterium]MBT5094996.1 peptidase S41 [Halobacteriovoraceae bacterium]
MQNRGYFQNPCLAGETLIFKSDDDLWSVPVSGGMSTRLTTSIGIVGKALVSPDGLQLAFTNSEAGQRDVYTMPVKGGLPERLSFWGDLTISHWENGKTLQVGSAKGSFSARHRELFSLNVESTEINPLNLGPASTVQKGPTHTFLGRNLGDPARWKRYRGGTAGSLWIDQNQTGNFKQILKNLKTNIANPVWWGERLLFISDHEGIGNIYSCNHRGANLKRHTDNEEYYIRKFSLDGDRLVFQSAGDLFLLELKKNHCQKIMIEINSGFSQAVERFETACDELDYYALAPAAKEVLVGTRGQLFVMPPWSGAPRNIGKKYYRHKCPTYLGPQKLLVVGLTAEKEEHLLLIDTSSGKSRELFPKRDWGKILMLSPNSDGNLVALSTNRNETWLLDLKKSSCQLIERITHNVIFPQRFSWSPDNRYLAFLSSKSRDTGIKIYDTKNKSSRFLITAINHDTSPVFDPSGKYLYFLSIREFHPNMSETHYELGFPFATRIYAVVLDRDAPSPFEQYLDFPDEKKEEEEESDEGPSKSKKGKVTKIDWDGIDNRIFPFPSTLGGHLNLYPTKDGLFYTKSAIKGSDPANDRWSGSNGVTLYKYSFKDKKSKVFHKEIFAAALSNDLKYIMLETSDGMRLVKSDDKPGDGPDYNKKDGYLDLDRITLKIDPKKEWEQMYSEAWILQREHFWNEKMSNHDWENVYFRYLPLLGKIHTRSEMSDLLWEMQGELGTSHCYEFMGDYFRSPYPQRNGFLGADWHYNQEKKACQIGRVFRGDSWIKDQDSPLNSPTVNLKEGDLITGIDGLSLDYPLDFERSLEAKAGNKVNLEVLRKGQKKKENVVVKTVPNEELMLYREWSNKNREYVHKKSGGKLGYLHIPNMSTWGYSEFIRAYLMELDKDGLIIDVRYNGGGSCSQHILKTLAQKIQGYDQTRYFGTETYPTYAVKGPLIAITNEQAGSDGDIFSHTFKLMKLGKLIGKRTWGGVVGIWPRQELVDGTYVSQAEFSFWFNDVGYAVENYGTDPDIEVEFTPQDYKKGIDPQLDRGIEEGLKDLKKNPPRIPNLEKKPDLRPMRLPKR